MYIYRIQHFYKYPFIRIVISDQTCNSDFSARGFNKQNYYYYYYYYPHGFHCEAWRGKTKLFWSPGTIWSLRNLIKQLFHSRLLDMRLVIATRLVGYLPSHIQQALME